MKRTSILLAALALAITACGGGDDTGDDTTTTAAAGTSATTTATTAATTTTTAALSGPEAFVAGAVEYVGEYRGEWHNTTFNSMGALYFNVVEANTTAGFVLIQVDADGNAFGGADPELFVIEIFTSSEGGLVVGSSPFLGDATFEIDESGAFSLIANPPMLGGTTLEVMGTISGDGFAGTYTIPGLAEGTWEASPAG